MDCIYKILQTKNFNIVELGPGDGSLMKILLSVFEKFPEFDHAKNIFLYETKLFKKRFKKRKSKNNKIKWVKNFNKIKDGPIIFFGNEFFDVIITIFN